MKKEEKNQMHQLHIELVKLQKEIIASGLKLLVILEGRDTAGKDGTIKRIIEHLSPRETRVVALGKPTDKEHNEWYFQRYTNYLPTSGEFVILNRSWYNRAGVEKVMNFCTTKQYKDFFNDVVLFEQMLVNANIIVIKYYLDISKQEQHKRLEDRKNNPLKQWKVSPIDSEAQKKWKEYSEARNEMLRKTNFKFAPWHIANAENKNDVHIALITHLLEQVKYKGGKKRAKKHELIFPATLANIKNKLYE
ncbi:MAG TPA: polyphosphate kinase 2 [Cytophagaceae bacterium]|nr:polyphosphate kinase 2 [Cytophagaceae bacterium]